MVIHSIRELNWKRKAKETVSIAGEEGRRRGGMGFLGSGG